MTWLEAEAKHGETPKALAMRPKIAPHLFEVWNAFWSLSGDRQIGAAGGCGRIPFLALDAIARRLGIDGADAFSWFKTMIERMDDEYTAAMSEKIRRATGAGKS